MKSVPVLESRSLRYFCFSMEVCRLSYSPNFSTMSFCYSACSFKIILLFSILILHNLKSPLLEQSQ